MAPSKTVPRLSVPGRPRRDGGAAAAVRRANLTVGGFGEARTGPVLGIPAVVRDLGLEPAAVFAQLGVDPALFERPDHFIGFAEVGRILEHVARVGACPHVGLLVGARFDPATLQDAGAVLGAPTVGAALRNFTLYHHLTDTGGVPMLLGAPGNRAVLAYSVYAGHPPGLPHILDLCALIGVRLLRALSGPSWTPLRIHLPRREPATPAPYRTLIGPHVAFDAEVLKIVFAASWLAQPVMVPSFAWREAAGPPPLHADPVLALPLVDVVRRALRPMVFTGTATQNGMADMLSLHPRSLSRHLRKAGTSFQALLNDARLDIARQLLAETSLTVTEIAGALHYSDMTAFTRAFRVQAGMAPTRWRERRSAAEADANAAVARTAG